MIKAVSLAINHIFDFGVSGIDETINLLDSNNIDWFGIRNKDLLLKECKLALHGYCSYNTNAIGLRSPLLETGVEPLIYSNVVQKFKNYVDEGYLNIVSVHSGLEHVNLPS